MTRLKALWHRAGQYMRRPVPWRSVLFSYIGILAVVSFTAAGFINAAGERDKSARESRTVIVMTGQEAIRNSCEFDNKRARELKVGLRLFLADHRQLHDQVNQLRHREDIPHSPERDTNIRLIQQGIRDITTRDCRAAAAILTADPKEGANAPRR